MHGPAWTFRANLTRFSLQSAVVVAASGAGAVTVLNATVWLAQGESANKYKSPLNVLKDTYDYSCY